MLDSDLAELYECANGTKTINLAVKRNIEKFPNDFYFQLTEEEINNLWFQNETAINSKSRTLPHVFTEEGVSMLSSVLHTKVASEVSVNIMRAFVKMRHFIMDNKEFLIESNLIKRKLLEHDNKLDELFSKFKTQDNRIFFNGEIYDAYSLLLDILKSAHKEIIIIDNYADKKILDLVSKLDVKVIIVSSNMNEELIKKYNKQYNNARIIKNNLFHDRFIIIDRNKLYVSGASFKDLGERCFGINKIEDVGIINRILGVLGCQI